tara:strand:- start:19 stop:591 length:573 start_codon:yes stop_codon:yes gene_type:complete
MVLDSKAPYVRIKSGWFLKNSQNIINELEPKVEKGLTIKGDSDKRNSDVYLYDIWRLDLSDFKKVIIFKIKEIFIQENKKYNYDLDFSTVNIQFTKYKVGQFYEWHTDDDFLNTHKKHNNIRKLSLSIPLNIGKYKGGDMELMINDSGRKINFEPGNVLVFPSFIKHRILPVTENIRYSLVSWISGPAWR